MAEYQIELGPIFRLGYGHNQGPAGFELQLAAGANLSWTQGGGETEEPNQGVSLYVTPTYGQQRDRDGDAVRLGAAVGGMAFFSFFTVEAGFVPKMNLAESRFEPGFRTSLNLGQYLNLGVFLDIPDVKALGEKGYFVGGQMFFQIPAKMFHLD